MKEDLKLYHPFQFKQRSSLRHSPFTITLIYVGFMTD